MKLFSKRNKKFYLTLSSICLAFCSLTMPLMATATSKSEPSKEAPTLEKPKAPDDTRRPPNAPCKCRRPFRRFTAAIESLQKEGVISNADIPRVYEILMKIPPESLQNVQDRDQTAADALYKDKVLTEEQYKKITEFLKANPPRR